MIGRAKKIRRTPSFVSLIVGLTLLGVVGGCEAPTPTAENNKTGGRPPVPKYTIAKSDGAPDKPAAKKSAAKKSAPDAGGGDKRSIVTSRSGKAAGLLTTPINAYFSAQERINFLQIEHGLKTFRALHGRKPKDFAEVEKEVLQGVKLPTLPPGERYIYDPNEGPHGTVMIQSGRATAAAEEELSWAWTWTRDESLAPQLAAAEKIPGTAYEFRPPKGFQSLSKPNSRPSVGNLILHGALRPDGSRPSLALTIVPIPASEEKDLEKGLAAFMKGLSRGVEITASSGKEYGTINGVRAVVVEIEVIKDGAEGLGFACCRFEGDNFIAVSAFDRRMARHNSMSLANLSALTVNKVDRGAPAVAQPPKPAAAASNPPAATPKNVVLPSDPDIWINSSPITNEVLKNKAAFLVFFEET